MMGLLVAAIRTNVMPEEIMTSNPPRAAALTAGYLWVGRVLRACSVGTRESCVNIRTLLVPS